MRSIQVIRTTASIAALSSLAWLTLPAVASAQDPTSGASAAAPLTRAQLDELMSDLEQYMRQERGRLEGLQSQVDVATLYTRLGDVAHVDQVRFFGPPYRDANEQRTITAFIFVPKAAGGPEHGSLLVWQRGDDELEIDSWSDVPELRDLLGRGVTIVAPTYPGAPEERLDAVPDYVLDRYPFLERGRVQWREPR